MYGPTPHHTHPLSTCDSSGKREQEEDEEDVASLSYPWAYPSHHSFPFTGKSSKHEVLVFWSQQNKHFSSKRVVLFQISLCLLSAVNDVLAKFLLWQQRSPVTTWLFKVEKALFLKGNISRFLHFAVTIDIYGEQGPDSLSSLTQTARYQFQAPSAILQSAVHWGPPWELHPLSHQQHKDLFPCNTALTLHSLESPDAREEPKPFSWGNGWACTFSTGITWLTRNPDRNTPLCSPEFSPAGSRAQFLSHLFFNIKSFAPFQNNYLLVSAAPLPCLVIDCCFSLGLNCCLVNTGETIYVKDEELRFVPYTVV